VVWTGSDPGVPTGTGEQLSSCQLSAAWAAASKGCAFLLPPPAPWGAFLSFGSEPWPRGWGGCGSPTLVPSACLAAGCAQPGCHFHRLRSPDALWMLGGWHSLELSSRDAVGCKGGTGVCWAWGWGTALGPTWD